MAATANDVDRGWAWVVLLASFGILVFVGSVIYGIGVIHVFLLDTFDEDPVKTSWVGSLSSSLCSLVGPLAGLMASRTCCRVTIMVGGFLCMVGFASSSFITNFNTLFLTYGVLVGTGIGLAYTPAMVVLNFYFRRKLYIACGLAVAGCGIGMMSGPMAVRWLTTLYGWRGMFLLMGGINFNIVLLGALCFPSKTELEHKNIRKECAEELHQRVKDRFRIFKNISFMTFCLSILLFSFGCSAVILHFPRYCLQKGATTEEVITLMTVTSICSIISRVLSGLGSSGGTENKYLLYFGSYGLSAVVALTFPLYSHSVTGRYVFAAFFGFYTTTNYSVLNPITVELVGLLDLALAFGIEMLVCGAGSLLGPPVAALVFKSVGDYSASIYLTGSVMMLSSVIGMLVMVFKPPSEAPEIVIEEIDIEKLNKSLEHIHMEPAQLLRSLTSLPGIFGASTENLHLPPLSFSSTQSPLAAENTPVAVST